MSMFYALMALCLSRSTLAQIITSGGCPDVQVQQNFNISRLAGRWYEQARFFTLYELGDECGTFDFISDSNNNLKIVSIGSNVVTGQKDIFETEVLVPDREQSAKMLVNIPMSPTEGHDNLWALGIDYDSWGVFFTCNAACSMNLQYAWIVTRAQVPDTSVLAAAHAVLHKNNIDPSRFMKIEQEKCRM